MIRWDTTKMETETIFKIAKRAHAKGYNLLSTQMDITAVHLNGNPLRLKDLLKADDFNFFHDISGIRNCLDRKTGKLTKCFLPRFSKREKFI